MPERPKPFVTIILDGWGVSLNREGNAIFAAETPTMDTYARTYPTAVISAAGIEVGLPPGEVGNSETGHRNMGAGQVQYQVLPKIDKAIADQTFFKNRAFLDAIAHVKKHQSRIYIIGLASPAGVHAHINHLVALLRLVAEQGIHESVYIHMITDGRDSAPQSALTHLAVLEDAMKKFGVGHIASVSGRFYAMDRNKNWDRTEQMYNMLTGGSRNAGAPNATRAIEQSYTQGIFDERIVPTAITSGGKPIGIIQDNDAIIFFNYRPDRMRQLTAAFSQPETVGFPAKKISNLYVATMAQYDVAIPAPFAFVEDMAQFPIARILSDNNLTQLHIAETEKYAHVTYYLNVGNEAPYPGQKNVLIPSSNISNFADDPNMQAGAITDRVVKEIQKNAYDVYFINFANADMVGHTGNFDATVAACSFLDTCIASIHNAVFAAGGTFMVTADHGNAEQKIGEQATGHTANPVPLHIVSPRLQRITPKSDAELANILSTPVGVLADVAPTMLDVLRIEKPHSMTGVSLIASMR